MGLYLTSYLLSSPAYLLVLHHNGRVCCVSLPSNPTPSAPLASPCYLFLTWRLFLQEAKREGQFGDSLKPELSQASPFWSTSSFSEKLSRVTGLSRVQTSNTRFLFVMFRRHTGARRLKEGGTEGRVEGVGVRVKGMVRARREEGEGMDGSAEGGKKEEM